MAASKKRGLVFKANVSIFIRFRRFWGRISGSEIIWRELKGVLLFWWYGIWRSVYLPNE
jgi:hypothetical protein